VKKVLLLVAAFLVIFSSVAAVSAYEAHKVDIKVHVENAIGVTTGPELNLGTMFPQETVETDIAWGMSRSFYAQDRLSEVKYNVYFELKNASEIGDLYDPTGQGPQPRYKTDYFMPLNPYMTLVAHGWNMMGPEVYREKPGVDDPLLIGDGYFKWKNNGLDETLCASMDVHIDIPVFDMYYNEDTDEGIRPGNWGTLDPLWTPTLYYDLGEYILVDEEICKGCAEVPHADLGINFKIQVTGFSLHSGDRTSDTYPVDLEGGCIEK
jgi:hypothetical protein